MSSLARSRLRLFPWALHGLRRAAALLDRIARLPIQFYRPPRR